MSELFHESRLVRLEFCRTQKLLVSSACSLEWMSPSLVYFLLGRICLKESSVTESCRRGESGFNQCIALVTRCSSNAIVPFFRSGFSDFVWIRMKRTIRISPTGWRCNFVSSRGMGFCWT
ncbi:hypothetical protein CEXT_433351 [Caerostris extrusa]|uniref:Uncharacterized protein n=1 Tax=Caerostris extrusa TaxID=172846 RepID=A0AAV4UVL8_CAEEX|nr:hypothetical protein CEXT_433351 [Caerostris extrusa]